MNIPEKNGNGAVTTNRDCRAFRCKIPNESIMKAFVITIGYYAAFGR